MQFVFEQMQYIFEAETGTFEKEHESLGLFVIGIFIFLDYLQDY
jgi:hypothetical protein